jgi:hypothetical protein
MKDVKKDLQMVAKEFKALRKKMGLLTSKLGKAAVDELEHAQVKVKLKSPAQHASDALKMLTRETDKLVKAVDEFEKEKAKGRKTAKGRSKAKGRKKSKPQTKKTGKTAVKKVATRKPVFMKSKAPTATDQVLRIVKRSKKGVSATALIKKTGLEVKTIRNILYRAVREGRIKRVGRGIYAGT